MPRQQRQDAARSKHEPPHGCGGRKACSHSQHKTSSIGKGDHKNGNYQSGRAIAGAPERRDRPPYRRRNAVPDRRRAEPFRSLAFDPRFRRRGLYGQLGDRTDPGSASACFGLERAACRHKPKARRAENDPPRGS